jgi:hypothetical protein
LVKGIQNGANHGPGPLQRGDHHKNAKIGWVVFKIFFSRTSAVGKLRFTQKLP